MKKAGAIAMAIFVLAGLGLHPVAAWDLICFRITTWIFTPY
jgi:hypothetical protein